MKAIHRTRNFIIAAFLLSLLFHTSSIIYVVWQGANTHTPQSLQEKEEVLKKKIQKREEWAETKAHASNFGAPVMFEDDPLDPLWQTTDDQTKNETKKTDENEPIVPEQKIIEEKIPEKITTTEKSVSSETPIEHKSTPNKKKASLKKRTTEQKKLTPAPFFAETTQNRPKPPLSLAQLTQGFLDQVKDEGKHAIRMLGKKNGMPSDEQIKYERYLQKINWCLQNSFKINNDRFYTSTMTEFEVHIFLALNRDGSIKLCRVAKTSGNRQFDQFILFIFNDASSSFPPVPHYLPYDPLTTTHTITLNATEQNNLKIYRL
ncbi:MAG TPA: TonB C-terminal domain-containing protein [Candidatus Babeliales bacterium]|nr:TonB C-terminal domain-containing protein [Candidatus Babeliales bacterium]